MKIPEVYRSLYELAIAAGWTVTRTGTNHLRWRSPSGRLAFTAGTPDKDPREYKNARAKLRRAGLKV